VDKNSMRAVGTNASWFSEQFHEAGFVKITHRRLAIWLDPFWMLNPQIGVNLLPKLGVRADLLSHSIGLVKDSSVRRNGSSKASPE
jgi:hypothetical protein